MFTSIDKALASGIMSILSLITLLWGWNLSWVVDEKILAGLLVLIPFITWAVPNKYMTVIHDTLTNLSQNRGDNSSGKY